MTIVRILAVTCALLLAGLPAAAQQDRASNLFRDFSAGSKEPVEVEADQLEVAEKDKTRISTFRGNVTVRRGATTLKAAVITITAPAQQAGGNNRPVFNKIEATGGVWVNSADQTATGERAIVDMAKRTVVLAGKVYLTQGENIISGEKLTIYLDSGRATVEHGAGGRIRGMFTPGSGNPLGQPRPGQ